MAVAVAALTVIHEAMRAYVVLAVAVLAAVGCRAREPAAEAEPAPAVPADAAPVRDPEAVIAAVAAYKARIAQPPLPAIGAAGFVEPPGEAELAWIADRATPLDGRLGRALALFDDTKAVMKAYGQVDLAAGFANAVDGPATLRWSESSVRQMGVFAAVILDELVPTLDPANPDTARRMGGLAKMGQGAATMLQGALITLRARRADLDARRRLVDAWRDHARSYARLMTDAQCAPLRGWIGEVRDDERDATIRAALGELATGLARCTAPS